MPTLLVIHGNKLDAICDLQVQRKGLADEVITWVLEKLELAGHSGDHISLKSEQEESTIAVKGAIAARRTARTSLIESQLRVEGWRTYWPRTSNCAVGGFVGCRGTFQI